MPEREIAPPRTGERYIAYTDPATGAEVWDVAVRSLRQTNEEGAGAPVFTVLDAERQLRWIRYDHVRGCYVRSGLQADGAPVPPNREMAERLAAAAVGAAA